MLLLLLLLWCLRPSVRPSVVMIMLLLRFFCKYVVCDLLPCFHGLWNLLAFGVACVRPLMIADDIIAFGFYPRSSSSSSNHAMYLLRSYVLLLLIMWMS